ncbi:MAG: hypothetical protein U0263_40170 [Polyangiaceae bacterium]
MTTQNAKHMLDSVVTLKRATGDARNTSAALAGATHSRAPIRRAKSQVAAATATESQTLVATAVAGLSPKILMGTAITRAGMGIQ